MLNAVGLLRLFGRLPFPLTLTFSPSGERAWVRGKTYQFAL